MLLASSSSLGHHSACNVLPVSGNAPAETKVSLKMAFSCKYSLESSILPLSTPNITFCKILKILTVWVFCLGVYLCTIQISGAHVGLMNVSGAPVLELQMAMRHHVVVGDRTLSLLREADTLKC